ncbi:uncharacterized protein [Aegilops tauschii subsp. strangulata]|uniref:uncharacterized protein n=1 Tax=Aegilops tauschii subsp. strangulata TaxID=200361 RepID=UPI003CC8DFDA
MVQVSEGGDVMIRLTMNCCRGRRPARRTSTSASLPGSERRKGSARGEDDAVLETENDWLQIILDTCNADIRDKILLLIWRAWFLRDNCVHGDGKESISRSASFLTRYEEEIRNCLVATDSERGKEPVGSKNICNVRRENDAGNHWYAPPAGFAKLNTDTAYNPDSELSYAGAVARDYKGIPVVSLGQNTGTCMDVMEAEACAIREGLIGLSALFNGHIIIETDCSTLAKELSPQATNRSHCFPIIRDIRECLGHFVSWQVNWISRERNKFAHNLAMEAKDHGDFKMIGAVPSRVQEVWLYDRNLDAF